MMVKVKWLKELPGHAKLNEVEEIDDSYAQDCEAAGYCEFVDGNPRAGEVKKGSMGKGKTGALGT